MSVALEVTPSTSGEYPIAARARLLAAATFVAGGLLQLLAFLLEPGDQEGAARVAWWLAHPGRIELSQTAGLLSVAGLVGTFWFAYPLLRAGSRRVAAVAVAALLTAMVGLAAVQGIELAAYWSASGGHPDAAVTILGVADPGIAGIVGFVMFLPMAVVGNVLAAIAMWRSRFVPRLTPLVVVAFSVLDFGAGLGVLSHAVNLVTGLLLAWSVLTRYARSTPAGRTSPEVAPSTASAGAQ